MKYFTPSAALAYFLSSASVVGVSALPEQAKGPCTALLKVVEYEGEVPEVKNWQCDTGANGILDIENLPPGMDEEEAESGNFELSHPSATVDKGKGKITFPPGLSKKDIITRKNKPSEDGRRLTRVGDRTVLAVRVVTPNGSSTKTIAELSDDVFGTISDPVNLRSQYLACSSNQLDFKPLVHPLVTNGAIEVIVSVSVNNQNDAEIRNAALTELRSMFGVSSNSAIADHIMLALPSGAMSGIAYAYVNSQVSVYSDLWASYLSGQMHEIGHNIGLAHSGEGATYDDQSGMMGFSYSNDDGPIMCFNGPKIYQLGWYPTRYEELTPLTSNWSGELTGLANVGVDTTRPIVLRLAGSALDYYVSFNYQSGFNSGTREAGNQVLVHSRPIGTNYAESKLLAKLVGGGVYTIVGFGSGVDVTIQVNSISGAIASVAVYSGDLCSSAADCDDGNACTVDTCDNGQCVNTADPTCCTSAVECDDGNACTTDTCDGSICVNTLDPSCCISDSECDDGDACTIDSCTNNQCVSSPDPSCCTTDSECDDGDACTTDTCVGNQCEITPIPGCCSTDTECDDGLVCNGVETCSNNVCVAGQPPSGNCCETNSDCDDGVFCNGVEQCVNNQCASGSPPTCVISQCPDAACNLGTDQCECLCAAKKESCSVDSDCCSNRCQSRKGAQTCN